MKIASIVTAAALGFAALGSAMPASAQGYYHHDGGGWHGDHRGYRHGYYGRGHDRGYWRHHRDWRRHHDGRYGRGYHGRHW